MSGNNTTDIVEQSTFTAVILPTFYLLLSIYVIIVNLIELVIITRIKTSSSTIFIARFTKLLIEAEVLRVGGRF